MRATSHVVCDIDRRQQRNLQDAYIVEKLLETVRDASNCSSMYYRAVENSPTAVCCSMMAPPHLSDPSQHCSSSRSLDSDDDVLPRRIYDNKRADHLTKVLVIGAGPQALAFVLRFRTRYF
jgi:hypothetical protein